MISTVSIELTPEELEVEVGGTAQLTVMVKNNGQEPDRFQIELEGLDIEFYAVPVPAFTVEPGEEKRERILIKPPKTSESRSGAYPFIVYISSLETGVKHQAQATLTVKPYNLLTVEIFPKRGVAGIFNSSVMYDLSLTNGGNTDLNLQLYASDAEDANAYEFETERLTIPAGATTEVQMLATPSSKPLIGTTKTHSFSVTARCVDNPYVSASTQAQLVRKAVTHPITLIMLLVILAGGLIYYMAQPQPIKINSFIVNPTNMLTGEKVNISWDIKNASRITILADGKEVATGLPANGSKDFTPTVTTTYEIYASNMKYEQRQSLPVTVSAVPPPKILQFTADKASISRGDVVTLRWKVINADQIHLSPLNMNYDPRIEDGTRDKPERATEYTLTAINSRTGEKTEERIKVEVCQAIINRFELVKQSNGYYEMHWDVVNAKTITIEPRIPVTLNMAGNYTFIPQDTTTYTLTATDEDNKTITKKVTAVVPPRTPPDNPNPPTGPVVTPP